MNKLFFLLKCGNHILMHPFQTLCYYGEMFLQFEVLMKLGKINELWKIQITLCLRLSYFIKKIITSYLFPSHLNKINWNEEW